MSSTKEFIRAARRASKRITAVVPNGNGSYTFSVRAPYGSDPLKRIVMVTEVDAHSLLEAKTFIQTKLQATDIKLLRFVPAVKPTEKSSLADHAIFA